MSGWLAVVSGALAAALAVPARGPLPRRPPHPAAEPVTAGSYGPALRLLWSLAAGFAAGIVVGGRAAALAGLVAAITTWRLLGRTEPRQVRRAREEVRRDLPHVVELFGAALRAGAAPGEAVALVCAALPGAAADRLAVVPSRLALGVDPVRVWQSLADDPELAVLGRTLVRAQATGASVVSCVARLADDLALGARADVEERARAVGVRAALPLGLCLLPSFLLLGIVPLVAGLLDGLAL